MGALAFQILRIQMRQCAVLPLCALLLVGGKAGADEIVLVSPDYWCPFSCKAGAPQEGFTVDIARAIFAPAGHKVRLVNANYSRALLDVRAGLYTATPSTFKEEAPDFVFPEQPISRNRYCVYVAPGSNWRLKGRASLVGMKIGVIRDYSYGTQWDEWIKVAPQHFDVHTGDRLTERLIRRLELARIDAFIEEENLVNYTLALNPKLQVRAAHCEPPNYAYLALSPKHPKAAEYARLFSEGIVQLHKSGQLKTIMSAYGLTTWALPER